MKIKLPRKASVHGRCFFVRKFRKGIKDMAKRVIYCPLCGRRVMEYDGKVTIPLRNICFHCHKEVIFNPETGKIKITKMPPRTTAGGMSYC